MTKITHARSNENGKITNGRPGDNNDMEICTTDFYVHNKGWNILRCTNPEKAKKIAACAVAIADNNAFGYDQDRRDTGITEAKKVNYDISKVTKNCDLDCSSLVRLCCLAAGIHVGDFYTGNEKEVLTALGSFKPINFTSEDDLRIGDILVTKQKGHTAIVTEVGEEDPIFVVDGWYKDGNDWYYYLEGEPATKRWVKDEGYWYRLGNDGKMLTGYHKVYDSDGNLRECYFGTDGKMYHEAPDQQGYLEPWLDI